MFGMNKEGMQGQLNELTERLKTEAGLSDEQAKKVLDTIRNFIVEKYPMLQGAMDNVLGGE